MASKSFLAAEAIPERSTYRYRLRLRTLEGEDVQHDQVEGITLTLRDVTSDAIVNGRNGVQVKNENGGLLTAGLFTFQLTSADTAILGTGSSERRLLTLAFTLTGGTGFVTRDVLFYVRNLRDVA